MDHDPTLLRVLFQRATKTKWAIGGVTLLGLGESLVREVRAIMEKLA